VHILIRRHFTARGSQGARHGKIFGVVYYAHIVAWAIHFGEWPAVDIDHESGNRSDNRLVNIREAGKSLNMQNKKIYKTNKTGVSWRLGGIKTGVNGNHISPLTKSGSPLVFLTK
jgi:hypothetical protein